MHVRWTTNAARDLTRIVEHIREDNPAASPGYTFFEFSTPRICKIIARRVARKMYSEIGRLSEFPQTGRVGLAAHTRELMLSPWPYIAVYEIIEDQVHVLRIRHASQDWP